MTVRSVVIGLVGAAFVCGYTYFNDWVIRQTMFVGNNMPISVYGGLILFLLFLNPLLLRARRRFALTGAELAVILALTLAACCVPGSGLMRTLTTTLMMPHHFNKTEAGWREQGAVEMIPPKMLAGVDPRVIGGDVLDPRGLARALAGRADGETPGVAAARGLLGERERAALDHAAEAASRAPPEGDRERAYRALDAALAALDRPTEGRSPLDRSARDEIRAAFTDVASAARPDAAAMSEALRSFDGVLERHTVPQDARDEAAAAARTAFAGVDAECRGAVAGALNALLEGGDLRGSVPLEGLSLSAEGQALLERASARAAGEEAKPLSAADVRELKRHILDAVFPKGLRSIGASRDHVRNGFVQGLSTGTEHIGLGDVPWYAWVRTLAFWIPLILSLWVAIVALAVVVHRQWADHEQLPYPIARFAGALMPAEGEAMGSIFRNRLFWIGAGAVLVVHVNNYLYEWFPGLVQIPTAFDFGSLRPLFPSIERGGGWFFFWPRLYFTPLAFAFFLPVAVSFSLGTGATAYAWVAGFLAGYGVALGGGGHYTPNHQKLLTAGAYVGVLLTIIYTGRHYYGNAFRRALGLRSDEKIERHVIWAARVFLFAAVVFMAQLVAAGLDWQIAVVYGLMTISIFVVMARVSAETGVFFIQPAWSPCVVLVGIFGARAFGPTTMAVMFLISTVLLVDPREALMPFVTNSLRVLDTERVRLGRPSVLCGVALAVGLAVGVPATLYFQYDRASHMADSWGSNWVPRFTFEETTRAKARLTAQGNLSASESRRGFSRLPNVSLSPGLAVSFLLGIGFVLLFTVARWRMPKFPLHPVMFLVWWYAGYMLAFSFLIGCAIKYGVTKYGGESAYKRLMPLMFGLIAGDMLGGIAPSIFGLFYYAITNELPKVFAVMPT